MTVSELFLLGRRERNVKCKLTAGTVIGNSRRTDALSGFLLGKKREEGKMGEAKSHQEFLMEEVQGVGICFMRSLLEGEELILPKCIL